MGCQFQGFVQVKVLGINDHKLMDTHITHGTSGSPDVFRISGLHQHDADITKIDSVSHQTISSNLLKK
jgi:hypothetical protein